MKQLAEWTAQVITVALGIVSVRVGMVERSRSIDTPIPREQATSTTHQVSASNRPIKNPNANSEAWGVAYRMTDHIDEAEISVPDLDEPRTAGLLKSHWRRIRSPFVGSRSSRGHLVQQIGLAANRASSPKVDASSDGHWHADPRLWGLDEGSYDQREAIIAPPPSRMTWHLSLPEKSRFQTSLATFAGEGEVRFEVSVVSAGQRHSVLQRTISKSSRWEDLNIDLSRFGGDVSIELATLSRGGSLAAWGSPIVTSPGASSLPYNVVFFVVDAMRSDALASVHDAEQDARISRAKLAPYDAWLPRMPEVAPNLDRLVIEGATFANAWTAAMWTRPATLAMLTGVRASRLGLPILELEPRPGDVRAFYATDRPLWPLLMRSHGAVTRAVINNMYLCGYVGVGVDTGFESLTDHRYQVKDTEKITADTLDWLESHRDDRFALFVNYVSPHAPHVPDVSDLDVIDHAPTRPLNKQVRRYLAEIRKDDAAIGRILQQLTKLNLSSKTLVIVTADHGETLSEAHDWVAVDVAKGVHSGRFTHLSTMWEEAARVPLIFALPGVIPPNRRIAEPVQTTDILPTVLELLRVDLPSNMDGISLKGLLTENSRSGHSAIIEGRGASAIIEGNWHFIQRSPVARRLQLGDVQIEKFVELYDLNEDPGERRDVSEKHSEIVEKLRRELNSRLAASPSAQKARSLSQATIHVRISSGEAQGDLVGEVALNDGRLVVGNAVQGLSVHAIGRNAFRLQTRMQPGALLDFDLTIEPASAAIAWKWQLAGREWPNTRYHVGALGLVRDLSKGIPSNDNDMVASHAPYVSAVREQGIFVTRDTAGETESTVSEAAQAEAQQAMQAWGYVRRNEPKPK